MDRADIATMNASMVERLLASPAEPIPDDGYALRVVRTRGRRSGEVRSTPLGVLRRSGVLHLVSPQADRDWVRNLAADPWCEVAAGDERDAYDAVPPPPDEAAETIAAYLRAVQAPWALRAFPVPADASTTEIAARLDAMVVLRLDPR